MTLDEVLDRLGHARSSVSRLDLRKLEVLARGELSPDQLERLRRIAPHLAEGRTPWLPGVGESFVLTWSAGGGEVARLRVERKGEPLVLEMPGLGPDAARQVRLVYQLLRRLAGAQHRGVPALGALGHVVSCSGTLPLDGASLGVSVAIAFVSSWLSRAPRTDVAATARVDGAGALLPVAHVDEKWRSLQRERPDVSLLVASTQRIEASNVVRAAHLLEALATFRLALDELPPSRSTREQRERELHALGHAQSENYSSERWMDFVDRAVALADDPDCEPEVRTMAHGHAMLFALHAGDPRRAAELSAGVQEAELARLRDSERAWVYVARASAAIDDERLDAAIRLAERAVEESHRLHATRDRREVVGRAYGTLGRALMHACRDEDARPWLEKGVEHHRQHLPEELPRSLCYLATSLRRLGYYDEAATTLEAALAAEEGDSFASGNTLLFLLYERARLHFERGEFDDCLRGIERIQRRQSNPADYPRLGTLRYEVACRALRGDLAYAKELRARAATLRLATPPGPLSQLAEAVEHIELEDPVGSRADWDRTTMVY